MIDGTISVNSSNVEWDSNTVGYRRDILEREAPILGNKRWMCMVTVAFVDDDCPKILCCRYHLSASKGSYVHMPLHPVGCFSHPGDSTISQVVAVPRTVRSFKAKKYTNSYHLNKVMGNYSGIDTINLTDRYLSDDTPRVQESIQKDAVCQKG